MKGPAGPKGSRRGLALVETALAGLAAFTGGAAVMLLEFVGQRFLQTYFGSAIEVWASIIATCLAGLACGYAIGGMLADRWPGWALLAAAFIVAGATAWPMEWLTELAGDRLVKIESGRQWHPLLAALIASFLPILSLGGVLPTVIRLSVRRLERVGAVAGWMSALSTAGSIAGVIATAYWLLYHFGVRETLYGASAALVGLGALFLAVHFGVRASRGAVMLLLGAGAACPAASGQVLYDRYSAYHHIRVIDRGQERQLRFDRDVQSIMHVEAPFGDGFEYALYFHTARLFDPTLERALFIGLGGGTGPKQFLADYPNVLVEVAEIDPRVVDVARQYFALPGHPRLAVYEEDGRVRLRRAEGRYGAIIVDAYASGPYGAFLPTHLVTKEFFELARRKMTNGGCLIYNVVGEMDGRYRDLIVSMRATLEAVFQEVYAFEALTTENTVFVAVKLAPREGGAVTAWPAGPWRAHPLTRGQLYLLARAGERQKLVLRGGLSGLMRQTSPVIEAPVGGPVLTDNFAPLDLGVGRQ